MALNQGFHKNDTKISRLSKFHKETDIYENNLFVCELFYSFVLKLLRNLN
jgi:hypothetical protein